MEIALNTALKNNTLDTVTSLSVILVHPTFHPDMHVCPHFNATETDDDI